MFYLLAIIICLAALLLLSAVLWLLSLPAWLLLTRLTATVSPRKAAGFLFAVRMAPFLISCMLTFGFVLPAFLKFEPRTIAEPIGMRLWGLSFCGLLLVATIATRTALILLATSKARARWSLSAREIKMRDFCFPVYCVENPKTLLAVAGIFRPKVFVGKEIAETLSPEELSAALAHEMAHVRAWDNLKQTLLKITRPPLWSADAAWINAAEIAADEAALSLGASALDLSSALVTAGRLGWSCHAAPSIVASHLVPARSLSAVQMRAKHLEMLLSHKTELTSRHSNRAAYWFFVLSGVSLVIYTTCFHAMLPWVHEALEFMVRP